MKHVHDHLTPWLGGELDAEQAAAVEAHLTACPDCRREADALAAVWRDLEAAAPAPARGSVWSGVRERTVGGAARGWFYGGGLPARLSLGAAALACGLMVGVVAPGGGSAAADDDSDLTLWLTGSSWLDTGGEDLGGLWLAGGEEGEEPS